MGSITNTAEKSFSVRNTANGGFVVEVYEAGLAEYPYRQNNTYSFADLTSALSFVEQKFNEAPAKTSFPAVAPTGNAPTAPSAPAAPVVEESVNQEAPAQEA